MRKVTGRPFRHTLALDFLAQGQYFRICGSRMNDGVYAYPPEDLADETFDGVIWEMRPPRAFLALAAEIEAWQAKYGEASAEPYRSERFGDYGYALKDGVRGWQGAFGARLNEWRKLA